MAICQKDRPVPLQSREHDPSISMADIPTSGHDMVVIDHQSKHLCRHVVTCCHPATAAARWEAARASASTHFIHAICTYDSSLPHFATLLVASTLMQPRTSPPGTLSLLFVALFALVATTATIARKHTVEQDTPMERRLEASLADARSLQIHFTLKRNSMKIYDQTEFNVFANPIVSSDKTAVRYDGYANFSEGDTKHTIMMVEGIAYLTTSRGGGSETAECLDSSSLEPLNYLIPALNEATAISSATVDGKKITCPSGDLFKVLLGDATFVLCASESEGFVVYGTDLDLRVKYLESRVPITAPKLSDDKKRSCKVLVTPSRVTPTTLALLTGESVVNTRSLAHYVGHYFSYQR